MQKTHALLLLAFTALLLSACGENGLYHLTWVTEGQHTLTGELPGDLIVLDGEVVIPAGARVHGKLHQLSGKVTIGGEVSGDIVFMGGELTLQPNARVGSNLNLANDNYRLSPHASVIGKINTGMALPDLPEQRPNNLWQRVLRTLFGGAMLGLFAALLSRYLPTPVQRVSAAAVHHSLVSGAMGLLVGLVGISLLITIAYTIILIPVTFLGLFLLGAAVAYGWVALGTALGSWVNNGLKLNASTSACAFCGTMAFIVIQDALTALPTVGALLGIALALVSLGAVFLTRLGLQHFVPQNLEANHDVT